MYLDPPIVVYFQAPVAAVLRDSLWLKLWLWPNAWINCGFQNNVEIVTCFPLQPIIHSLNLLMRLPAWGILLLVPSSRPANVKIKTVMIIVIIIITSKSIESNKSGSVVIICVSNDRSVQEQHPLVCL